MTETSTNAADRLAERVVAAMYERDAASQAIGLEIVEARAGCVKVTMQVRADMLNGHDICHGGFIFAMADSAFAFACNSFNEVTVAAGVTIDFLAPARKGDRLLATATVLSRARRTGLYDVSVTKKDGSLIATFRGRSHQLSGHVVPA